MPLKLPFCLGSLGFFEKKFHLDHHLTKSINYLFFQNQNCHPSLEKHDVNQQRDEKR